MSRVSHRALRAALLATWLLPGLAATARAAEPLPAETPLAAASVAERGRRGHEPAIRFDWPALTCPDRQSVVASLGNLDLAAKDALGDEVPLPEAAAIDPPWVEARVRSAPAPGTDGPVHVELVIRAHGRTIARGVDLAGSCSERGVVVAAIIERAIRPDKAWPGGAPTDAAPLAGEDSGGDAREFEVTLAPQTDGNAPAVEDAAELDEDAERAAEAAANLARQPLWILNGSLVVLGGEGPTFRGGADAELRYEFSQDLFAVARLSYRSPRVRVVGPATIRIDDAWAALGLHIGSPTDAIALQTTAIVQVAWSHGDGLEKQYNEVRANPGVTVGACYQKSFETWGFEGCVRGFGFLRRQEIHVNDEPVLGLPRVGGELALGVSYQI